VPFTAPPQTFFMLSFLLASKPKLCLTSYTMHIYWGLLVIWNILLSIFSYRKSNVVWLHTVSQQLQCFYTVLYIKGGDVLWGM
jgi:hypothetical protein